MQGYDTEGKIICPANMFSNSKGLFIEYMDILKAPYYMIYHSLSMTPIAKESIFDTSSLAGKSSAELAAMYYDRRNQNILYDLVKSDAENVQYDCIDIILDNIIKGASEVVSCAPVLNLAPAVFSFLQVDSMIAGKVYVYYPFDNEVIKKDVEEMFEEVGNVTFLTGPLEKALHKVPIDTTYVFSDISKVNALVDIGKIDYSSIVVPVDYGYNYVDSTDRDSGLLVDIVKLSETHPFKFDMFLASAELPK